MDIETAPRILDSAPLPFLGTGSGTLEAVGGDLGRGSWTHTTLGFWILETEGRRVLGRVGAAWILDSWILDTGRSVGGPGREGRRTLDSGFWILGRRSREGRPSDSGFWILETGVRCVVGSVPPGFWILGFWILGGRSEVLGGRAVGLWILDSGYWVGGPGREGRRTLDSGFWKLRAVGGSVPPGFWILGFWILQSATRVDSGFLDSGFCRPPLATAWILDSWILETARIQNPDARILDPGFWILDSAQLIPKPL